MTNTRRKRHAARDIIGYFLGWLLASLLLILLGGPFGAILALVFGGLLLAYGADATPGSIWRDFWGD